MEATIRVSWLHSNSSTLLLSLLLDFEDSDDESQGSQEPDKQLTSTGPSDVATVSP
ncbi:MAG: hypothetical protein PHC88_14245 [Terrimicrobiaceae bacterium]|nr:hypothetical protein [Terrimicrobiaceae bacterium]